MYRSRLSVLSVVLFIANLLAHSTPVQGQESSKGGVYYEVKKLNPGLPPTDSPPDRSTPRAAMESFYKACNDEDYLRAARVLELRDVPADEQKTKGPELARKLHYVLNQRLWMDWDELSSRPDALITTRGSKHPRAGKPQKSLLLKKINVQNKVASIRLHRVKPEGGDAVWLFSAQSVDKIQPLYNEYGPSWIQDMLPAWAKVEILLGIKLWEGGILVLGLALAALGGWLTQRLIQVTSRKSPVEWYRTYTDAMRLPAAVTVGTLIFYLVNVLFLRLPGPVSYFLEPLVLVAFVASVCWLLLRALNLFTEHVIKTYIQGFDEGTSGTERQLLTQLSVGRRLVTLIGVCVAVGIVLVQLRMFEMVGFGLLASAGVAGIVLGIAAKPVLGNLIAGLQIAVTRPVRISDVVVYAGEWGYVENITFAYLVIRTWDSRRVMVPLQHFISHPVENWSKINTHLIKPIYLYVDYRMNVELVRNKFKELLHHCEDWDEEVEAQVLVTELTEETMQLRALCSAKDPTKAWYLHCHLREELINFIRELDDGKYLPRQRLDLEPITVRDGQPRKRKRKTSSET